MSAANLNVGHGYVNPRPDGAKARCGGPGVCKVCQAEKAPAITPPVAAGSVDTPSIDHAIPTLYSFAKAWCISKVGAPAGERWEEMVSFIDTWGAQQREAGRQEVIGMQLEFMGKLHAAEGRAEKAEARVAELMKKR